MPGGLVIEPAISPSAFAIHSLFALSCSTLGGRSFMFVVLNLVKNLIKIPQHN
jgi:hypothetical protein